MLSAITSVDTAMLAWVVSLPHPAWLTALMRALTYVGVSGAVWLVMGALMAWRWKAPATSGVWRATLAVTLALVASNHVMKPLVARPRPFTVQSALAATTDRPPSYSFPSGHTASAVAGAYALSLVWPRRRRWLWTLAVLIALSRLYLGVHYPLDIAAGALLGWACAYFATAGTPCYTFRSLPRPA